ncbi:MAG: ABC transporter permease subunit [Anaerolineales bacterium]|nr:ABC transporter permease subunit [Anaerolineales bacterium]
MNRLWTTLRYTFTGLRGQTLGWGLGFALYGLMIVPMYGMISQQQDQLQQMIASYPPEFLAFFGGDANSLITPAGFLKMYAFSMMPVIIGIFAVIAGSGLIASDEEHGRLDLIIAHPVGRSAFFWGRLLGLLAASLSIMFLGWLGFCLLLGGSSLGFNWGEMAVPFLSLLAQILVYASLALLLSMFLPSRNLAAMLSGVVMVSSYMVSSLAFMDERMAAAAKLMPYHYFQPVLSFADLDLGWLLALLAASALMCLVAWLRFTRRDIRLSGEGSWRLPLLSKSHQAG